MSDVMCTVCGMPFEEEGARALGASQLERRGKTFWFCCPPCEREFHTDPSQFGG